MSPEIHRIDVSSAFRIAIAIGGVNGIIVSLPIIYLVAQSFGGLEIYLTL